MTTHTQQKAVQIICDLRGIESNVHDKNSMRAIWQQANTQLVGKSLLPQQPLEISLANGTLTLWIVDAKGLQRIEQDTTFDIVDILRNPALRYHCKVCNAYGPLRCVKCVEEKSPEGAERLCSQHAYFVKDSQSAYCPKHKPTCRCSPSCKELATFACNRCSKPRQPGLFGEHYRHPHPQNSDIDYCQRCYAILFERCEVCNKQGKTQKLAGQHCAYKTRSGDKPCGMALCWEHCLQWKIWGQHCRGLPFCEKHKQLLSKSDPADALFMMITAIPPRNSIHLSNIFRLRRLINRGRTQNVQFEQLGQALYLLKDFANSWDERARQRYSEIMQAYTETKKTLPQLQNSLLQQITSFYAHESGHQASSQIVGLEVVDCFSRQGSPQKYHLNLVITTPNKGPFIGRGGALIRQVYSQHNIERLDFSQVINGRIVPLNDTPNFTKNH